MDQIDFTGPFEVLSRMPDTAVTVVGKELGPIGTARQAEAIRYAKLLWPVRDCRGTKSPLGAKSAPQGGVVMMSHNKKSDNPASRDQVPNYTKLRAGDISFRNSDDWRTKFRHLSSVE